MNSPIPVKEIEFILKIFLTKKTAGINGFTDEPDVKG